MASIFSKPTPTPPSEKRFADIELSISNRYKSLDDKIDSRMDGLQARFIRLDEQVTELLKRTYDAERKIEGQLIDVENTAKKQFHNYDNKIDNFEKRLDGKYSTVEGTKNLIDDIAGTIRLLKNEIDETTKSVKVVEAKIPKNTVDKSSVEDAISTLNNAIMKVANAIPKNTASTDLVADVRKEIIKIFDSYSTTEALKSVKSEVDSKIDKVAKASASTTKLSKETQSEFNKLASTVKDIKADYTPKSVIPSINNEIAAAKAELLLSDKKVIESIPTKFVKPIELDNVKDQIRTLGDELLKNKTMLNESINISQSQIDKIVKDSISYFDNKVKELEAAFSDKSGIDSERMKNIIREVADEEIKLLRNTTKLLQDNVKQNVIEVKNQNKNLANKFNELQKDFFKVLKLTNITK